MSDDLSAYFSDSQRRTLGCVLERLIPAHRDSGKPSAADVLLDGPMAAVLQKNPGFDATIAEGLAALDEVAAARDAQNFASLPSDQQTGAMNEVSSTHPGFLPGLVFHTFVQYYQDARVVSSLGVESHPPFPGGFELEEGDLTLLDPVRQRGKHYRDL